MITVIVAIIGLLSAVLGAALTGWFLLKSKHFERETEVTIHTAESEVSLQALLRDHTQKFFDRYTLELHEAENKLYISEIALQGAENENAVLKQNLAQAVARAERAEARAEAAEARAERAEAKCAAALIEIELLMRRFGVFPSDALCKENTPT